MHPIALKGMLMENPWRRIQALNDETEIWWDTSPLLWGDFIEQTGDSARYDEHARQWLREELSTMFLPAPVEEWIFKGCTTNPPLSWEVLRTRPDEWDAVIREKRRSYAGKSKYGLFLEVYFEVIRRGAELFLPLFEATGGRLGHISGQIDPRLLRNAPAMKEMGEMMGDLAPNMMIKVPGSTEGMEVFKYLASKGIATNATTVFTVPQILEVGRMVAEGRAIHLRESAVPRKGWRAVCTHMSGRFEDSAAFRGEINACNLAINPLELRCASEAVVKKCARLYQERGYPVKLLQCSSRPHRDADGGWFYPHIEMFAGGNLIFTVQPHVFSDVMVYYRDREITDNWKRDVPDEMIAKLSQVDYFRRAFDERGYHPEEFSEIPSLLENEAEFVGATKEMIEYVGNYL